MDVNQQSTTLQQPPLLETTSNHRSQILAMVLGGLLLLCIGFAGGYFLATSSNNQSVTHTSNQANKPSPTVVQEAILTPDSLSNWKTFKDPKGRFTFQYPSHWTLNQDGNNFYTPAGELDTHSIGFIYDNTVPVTGATLTVGVYEDENTLSAYDFAKKYWCTPGSFINSSEDAKCLDNLKIHDNYNGTQFSIIELLYIIPGALGPGIWATHNDYGVFILATSLRYDNKEDLELINHILSTFQFSN